MPVTLKGCITDRTIGAAILSELARVGARQIGVDDGTRTHDGRDHNPGLYQLSYVHRRNPCPRALAPNWRARQDSNLRPSA